MAITVVCRTDVSLTLEEYCNEVQHHVDFDDLDSIAASAPWIMALANNRGLVTQHLNGLVREELGTPGIFTGLSAQVLPLANRSGFSVRAMLWPSTADIASGRLFASNAYHLAHDHNFHFLTVPVFGPGYVTEIYEYDQASIVGTVGETVDLKFLERVDFGGAMAMLYRAGRDVHVQLPPKEFSITLNLVIHPRGPQSHSDQYFFDLETRRITGLPCEQASARRVSAVDMAGLLGDDNTRQLLADLSTDHLNQQTRLHAYSALLKLDSGRRAEHLERGIRDANAGIRRWARQQLERMGSAPH